MNQTRLFVGSCFALVSTALAFSLRGDIVGDLKREFGLSDGQIGEIIGPGLWGFAITIIITGMILDKVGMKRLMVLAFIGHVVGVLMTIFATNSAMLFTSFLLVGLANGIVEGVINPLIATMYKDNKTKYLNILHAWWPGGLVIGGLLGYGFTIVMGLNDPNADADTLSLGWKIKTALVLIPTFIYGWLLFTQQFPATERVESGVSTGEMWMQALRPMFILMFILMFLTAITELGPDQWIPNMLEKKAGFPGILILVYTAGLMFILRQFCTGFVVGLLTPIGTLIAASVLSAIGLYALSLSNTGLMIIAAATIFGIGKTFFWPTMLGVVAERFPKGGALLLCLMGGAGMLSAGYIAAPTMGTLQDQLAIARLSESTLQQVGTEDQTGIDAAKVAQLQDEAVIQEVQAAQSESVAGTLRYVSFIPVILAIIFLIMFIYYQSKGGYKAVSINDEDAGASNGGAGH